MELPQQQSSGDVQKLQEELLYERERRRAAEQEVLALRAAIDGGLKHVVDQVQSSNASLSAEVQRLVELVNSRNSSIVQHLSSIAPPGNSAASDSTASLNSSGSAPSTPLATRTSSRIMSPVVHGLLNELEVLDNELERRYILLAFLFVCFVNRFVKFVSNFRHSLFLGFFSVLCYLFRVSKDKKVAAFNVNETVPISSLAPQAMALDTAVVPSSSIAATSSATAGSGSSSSVGEQRHAIVESMFAHEEDYLDSIGSLIKGYLEPLQEHATSDGTIVSSQDMLDIFCTIQQIYESHRQLRLQLQHRLRAWTTDSEVGDVLCEMPDMFEPYKDYIVNFGTGSEVIIYLY